MIVTPLSNRTPDRVPVAPDISTYIPMKMSGLTGSDFWMETRGVPQWQAYLGAADYFGIDAWTAPEFVLPTVNEQAPCEWRHRDELNPARDAMVRTSTVATPDGELATVSVCFRGDQAMMTEKPIKNLAADFRKFKHTQPMPKTLDVKTLEELRQACRKRDYAFGVTMGYPGFHNWNTHIQGGIETLAYVEMDTPGLLQEWFEWEVVLYM
jgi:hypothetical protein